MSHISHVSSTPNSYSTPSSSNSQSVKKPLLLSTLAQTVKGDKPNPAADLAAEVMQDDFFQAGIGVKSLAYTFLLLKTFCELEVEMMLSSNDQMKLTTAMYTQMAESERRIAEDTWKSSLARGISQIASGAVSIGTFAIGTRAQNKTLKTQQAELQGSPLNRPGTPSNSVTPANSASNERVSLIGEEPAQNSSTAPASTSTPKSNPTPSNANQKQNVPELEPGKKAQQRAEAQGTFYQLLARSLSEIIGGVGTVVSGIYETDAKREEAIKQLIQAVISNTDASKQRANQQYEEAARKVEEAIQSYNAALQAAH